MDFYLDVLRESILVSAPVPFVGNPTFFAMLGFGGYNMYLAAAMAVIGAMIGTYISFLIGTMMFKICRNNSGDGKLTSEGYNKAAHYYRRFFMPLLLLSWLPMFNFLAVAAGFLGHRFKLVIALVLIGQVIYYGYFIFK